VTIQTSTDSAIQVEQDNISTDLGGGKQTFPLGFYMICEPRMGGAVSQTVCQPATSCSVFGCISTADQVTLQASCTEDDNGWMHGSVTMTLSEGCDPSATVQDTEPTDFVITPPLNPSDEPVNSEPLHACYITTWEKLANFPDFAECDANNANTTLNFTSEAAY